MGELEILSDKTIVIYSNICLYGEKADKDLAERYRDECETLWNEIDGIVRLNDKLYLLRFKIQAEFKPNLTAEEVKSNNNPRNNYFRVEDFSPLNISWVDGLGSNTGYMQLDNLYLGSTTAAHEYGHTLGLDHPADLNLIGKGQPGIMYPRGTLVDPEFQYDPNKQPGEVGGTIHPIHRRVNQEDIDFLKIDKLLAENKKVIGKLSSIYHPKHVKPISA